MRGVYYALTFSNDEDMNHRLAYQLENSLRTLRRHNTEVEALVCVFNGDISELVKPYDVTALELGSYAQAIRKHCEVGTPALSRFPLLPQWLALASLEPSNFASLLYCPSSKSLGRLSLFHNEGSGSSWIDVKPLGADGSSGGFG